MFNFLYSGLHAFLSVQAVKEFVDISDENSGLTSGINFQCTCDTLTRDLFPTVST